MASNPHLTLSGPDLAALLCSRVCHDIISPVGAINNGLELLDEGGADEDAMDLIRSSARNASVRLRFARLAFGASGSVGASIDTGEAEKVVLDFAGADGKTEVSWQGPRAIVAKNKVKLLLNLFLVANGAIPRGGSVTVELADLETAPRFTLVARGGMVRVPAKFLEIQSGSLAEPIDAHSIQLYYTVLLGCEAGMVINVATGSEEATFTAVPA